MDRPVPAPATPHGGKMLYTAKTHTTKSQDTASHAAPTAASTFASRRPGGAGIGTNPEQLLAAGW